jgi:16S rRNA (cytosine967-C5)-methyltransferase
LKYHKHLLQSCVEALEAIFFEDRYADKCIEYYLRNNKKWGSRDRRFFAETVYDCVRWWRLDWALLGRSISKLQIDHLAVSFWRRQLPLPDLPEFQKIQVEGLKKAYSEIKDPAVLQAFPDEIYQLGQKELGTFWDELTPYLNQVNDLILRVNTSKTNREELIRAFAALDIEAEPLPGTPSALWIKKRVNVFRTDLFKKGLFEVQDGSSQQVASFLDIEPGQRIIDACAGAGGKSLHIADLMQNRGKVISLDIHSWKLDQLKLRARRNSYSNIEMKTIEGSKTIKRLKGTADRLLLDVPCSGLGVLRRNPDTKWKLTPQAIEEVKGLQKEILQNYSEMLKSGGKLLYSTCSILPSENQEQVQTFLSNNSSFQLIKQRHLYPTRPGYDGFYLALMQKS